MNNPFRRRTGIETVLHFNVNSKMVAEATRKEKGDPARVMTRSQLQGFSLCPEKWRNAPPEEATKAMDWGSLVDALILCPQHLDDQIAIAPAVYPCKPTNRDPRTEKPWNWNATFCGEWRDDREAEGRIVVTAQQYQDALAAAKRFMQDAELAEFRKSGEVQAHVLVEYEDEATGLVIPIESVLDIVPDPRHAKFGNMLGDLKTSYSAVPRRWAKIVFEQGHYYQAAFHLDAMNAASGINYTGVVHLVIESEAPWQIGRRPLSPEFLQLGRRAYLEDLHNYCACLKEDRWPGYDDIDDPAATILPGGWRLVEPEPWMLRNLEL